MGTHRRDSDRSMKEGLTSVSLGTFVGGHAPAESFSELIRIMRTDAHIIFTVRDDVIAQFQPVMEAHEWDGRWQLVEETQPFATVPESNDPHGINQIFVYTVS